MPDLQECVKMSDQETAGPSKTTQGGFLGDVFLSPGQPESEDRVQADDWQSWNDWAYFSDWDDAEWHGNEDDWWSGEPPEVPEAGLWAAGDWHDGYTDAWYSG